MPGIKFDPSAPEYVPTFMQPAVAQQAPPQALQQASQQARVTRREKRRNPNEIVSPRDPKEIITPRDPNESVTPRDQTKIVTPSATYSEQSQIVIRELEDADKIRADAIDIIRRVFKRPADYNPYSQDWDEFETPDDPYADDDAELSYANALEDDAQVAFDALTTFAINAALDDASADDDAVDRAVNSAAVHAFESMITFEVDAELEDVESADVESADDESADDDAVNRAV